MRTKISKILLIVAAVSVAVIIYHYPPSHNKHYPPCIFKKVTGLDCAGCGSARACYQLMHGNIGKAANHNILLLLFIPVIIIGFAQFFTGKMHAAWQWLNKPMFMLCLIIFFWIIRNIPLTPFTWLHSDK